MQLVLLLEPPYILQGRAAPLQEGSGSTGGSGVRSVALLSCPNCPKTFTGPGRHQLYERHVIVHTGERPFNCPHCTYRANQLSNLRRHIKSIHQPPNQSGNNPLQGQHYGNATHQAHVSRGISQQVAVALMPHNQNLSSRSFEEQRFTTNSSSSFQHQFNRENFEGGGGLPRQ
ncbi:Zinc finger protein 536-like 9 [Homarus americanus]|uniref:Zinc finger protein 536-like 9 n=1 Tax=Homarus americanus TaxID=6706 RepID=A0A8J5K4H7_HOMAM|nr:Zinc finger protein 536-like 9 [Homarus americanus]